MVAGGAHRRRCARRSRARPAARRTPAGLGGTAHASRRVAIGALAVFAVLLAALPLAREASDSHAVATADSFYRTGALVFGGGHVVLPLLESRVVAPGWVSQDDFLAGYGAAQAVPGPLFTFAGYLGAVQTPEPNGNVGGMLALVAIFLPAFLLVTGVLPFWDGLCRHGRFLAALAGVNAVVVGILLAALVDPVFTSAVDDVSGLAVATVALIALATLELPPWAVVLGCTLAGAAVL